MILPEGEEQSVEAHETRVEHDQHSFVVACLSTAHLLIRRVWCAPPRVPHGRRVDSGNLPEHPLGTPEASHSEEHLFNALRKRRDQWRFLNEMFRRNGHCLHPARQCVGQIRKVQFT